MLPLRQLLQLARLPLLVFAMLGYGLGLAVLRYLGRPIEIGLALLGAFWVLLLWLLMHWLAAYFRDSFAPVLDLTLPEQLRLRAGLFHASLALLTVLFALLLPVVFLGRLSPTLLVYLLLAAGLGLAYGLPPLRLSTRGLDELTLAVLVGHIFPALAYLFQEASLHRLLPVLSLPLPFMALAVFLAFTFPTFASDQKYHPRALLVRAGWENGMQLHNALLLLSYLLLASLGFLGVPFRLVWPALLTLPLAVYEIFMFRRIADGAKPEWRMLGLVGGAILGLTLYLMSFTLLLN